MQPRVNGLFLGLVFFSSKCHLAGEILGLLPELVFFGELSVVNGRTGSYFYYLIKRKEL